MTCSRSFFHLLVRSWFAQVIASGLLSLMGFFGDGRSSSLEELLSSEDGTYFSSSFSLSWVVRSCWESETSNYRNQRPLCLLGGNFSADALARLFWVIHHHRSALELGEYKEAVGLSIVLGFEGISRVWPLGRLGVVGFGRCACGDRRFEGVRLLGRSRS